jgi:Zn-dependent M28 family amino/carboxypeptidase
VLLGAHWDSRPLADEETDERRRAQPVLGANDAASACAVLLTLAEMFADTPPAVGVDLAFFDGEDAGLPDSLTTYCLGSAEFARRLDELPAYAIVLDMIGDRDLEIRPERHSMVASPAIQRYVWDRARRLAIDVFVDEPVVVVYDDHVPLIEAGVKAIDLIDFDYEFWHTVEDTPEKCSAVSLGLVGELVASLVYEP